MKNEIERENACLLASVERYRELMFQVKDSLSQVRKISRFQFSISEEEYLI